MTSNGKAWISTWIPGAPGSFRAWRSVLPLVVGFSLSCFSLAWSGCSTWTGSIGAILAKDNRDGRVFVREVPPDMPAGRAGVLVDDEVVAVDGHPVRTMSTEQLHHALSGNVGTRVKLQISRNGTMREFWLERGPLRGPQPAE